MWGMPVRTARGPFADQAQGPMVPEDAPGTGPWQMFQAGCHGASEAAVGPTKQARPRDLTGTARIHPVREASGIQG